MSKNRLRAYVKVEMVPLFTTDPHRESTENYEQTELKLLTISVPVFCVPVLTLTQNLAQTTLDSMKWLKGRLSISYNTVPNTAKNINRKVLISLTYLQTLESLKLFFYILLTSPEC